ncbi:ribosome biogenesis protein [Ophiostoma piceae UAMH 11346]|uniref:Ribosome biogenesis regulatory protein n=1 Tax=Ophiostoma piceae (strain UAMH 11346) TaxID=1262450 RepID=S3CDA9_OPHP1|nr:ribosome biogenesis protein [Ophiostoma piceae UAMH 11346]
MTTPAPRPKLPVAVEKATPYTFDLGLLLANDANPADTKTTVAGEKDQEKALAEIARDGAQALVNQLLTTCRIERTTTDGVLLNLPPVTTPMPREKAVPAPKPPTKWEAFALRKGITPKTREQRRNLQYNAETNTWERKWGYKGTNRAEAETEWVVEVKEKDFKRDEEHAINGTSFRGDGRRERKERVRRNARKMRKNEEHAAKE